MKKENLVENAANTGNYLINELKKIPQIKEVRGEGLMIGLEFDQPVKEIRSKLLFEQKVFTGVSGTNVIRLLPPLVLTTDQASNIYRTFKKSIELRTIQKWKRTLKVRQKTFRVLFIFEVVLFINSDIKHDIFSF